MLEEPISNIALTSFREVFCLDSMMNSYSEDQISLVNKKRGCYLVHPTPHDFQYEYTGESYIV